MPMHTSADIFKTDVDLTPHNLKIHGWLLWFLHQHSTHIGLTIKAPDWPDHASTIALVLLIHNIDIYIQFLHFWLEISLSLLPVSFTGSFAESEARIDISCLYLFCTDTGDCRDIQEIQTIQSGMITYSLFRYFALLDVILSFWSLVY